MAKNKSSVRSRPRARTVNRETVVPRAPSKLDAVLRLLRGAELDDLAKELGVRASEIAEWRDEFLSAGMGVLDGGTAGSDRDEGQKAVAKRRRTTSGWRTAAALRTQTGRPDGPPPERAIGLRERKKTKTRTVIREHAMRLFNEQGFDTTTVNQIAEAAEVSSSTFFRYFASKEAVVFDDDSDVSLAEAFRAQPPELSPVQAAYRALMDGMSMTASTTAVREQIRLCLTVPELRAVLFDNTTALMTEIAELTAERLDRDPDDPAVRTFAAAVEGVWISTLFDWTETPDGDLTEMMAEAMALLDNGVPL